MRYDFYIYGRIGDDSSDFDKTIYADSDEEALAKVEEGKYLDMLDKDNENCFAELQSDNTDGKVNWRRIKAWDNLGKEKFIDPNKVYSYHLGRMQWEWKDRRTGVWENEK